MITAYEDAALAFATNGAQESYRLDTGQSVVNVTRSKLPEIQNTLDTLYSRLASLESRLRGGGCVNVQPGW